MIPLVFLAAHRDPHRRHRTRLEPVARGAANARGDPGKFAARVHPRALLQRTAAMVIADARRAGAARLRQFRSHRARQQHADPAVWRPVEAHCATLGPRFRVSSIMDGVKGFKAGALNEALR
jgi:hypothetical protein